MIIDDILETANRTVGAAKDLESTDNAYFTFDESVALPASLPIKTRAEQVDPKNLFAIKNGTTEKFHALLQCVSKYYKQLKNADEKKKLVDALDEDDKAQIETEMQKYGTVVLDSDGLVQMNASVTQSVKLFLFFDKTTSAWTPLRYKDSYMVKTPLFKITAASTKKMASKKKKRTKSVNPSVEGMQPNEGELHAEAEPHKERDATTSLTPPVESTPTNGNDQPKPHHAHVMVMKAKAKSKAGTRTLSGDLEIVQKKLEKWREKKSLICYNHKRYIRNTKGECVLRKKHKAFTESDEKLIQEIIEKVKFYEEWEQRLKRKIGKKNPKATRKGKATHYIPHPQEIIEVDDSSDDEKVTHHPEIIEVPDSSPETETRRKGTQNQQVVAKQQPRKGTQYQTGILKLQKETANSASRKGTQSKNAILSTAPAQPSRKNAKKPMTFREKVNKMARKFKVP
jgi:hypothetical protein